MDWDRESGATATNQLIDSGMPFDALRAFNDALALGALRVLRERGIRVPEEVAVIGLDDIDEARHSHPSLSTTAPDRDEQARVSIDLRQEQMSGPKNRVPAARTVSCGLRQRGSTSV